MWLLHASLLKLEFFQGSEIPAYAILSHRWQDEEVTFDDLAAGSSTYTNKKGWQKILGCCELARNNNFVYVWIDTCCIDKRSSAELSEAINSMYDWYKSAAVCYAYLFDVHEEEDLGKSSWFHRSWTLQELLAPKTVIFYDVKWQPIGDKASLRERITSITSIPRIALNDLDINEHSIARRMSWAAKRKATRVEDIAYSLLGLLDINMPLLYGEGEKAFQRLQEEIMRNSNDLSIFTWSGNFSAPRNGMLARSPEAFSQHGSCGVISLNEGYSTNNAGVTMTVYIEPLYLDRQGNAIFSAHSHEPRFHTRCVRISLRRVMYSDTPIFYRVPNFSEIPVTSNCTINANNCRKMKLLVGKKTSSLVSEPDSMRFRIVCPGDAHMYVRTIPARKGNAAFRKPNWETQDFCQGGHVRECIIPARGSVGIAGYITWTEEKWKGMNKTTYCLCFGHDVEFRPICLAFHCPVSHSKNPLSDVSSEAVMNHFVRLLNHESSQDMQYSSDWKFCAGRAKLGAISSAEVLIMDKLNMNIRLQREPEGTIDVRVVTEYAHTVSPATVPLSDLSIEDADRIRRLFI